MNDERPFERLAAHAGSANVDPGFDDSLYTLLQIEMRRTGRPSRLTLLLVATLLLALALGGAVLVGSGIVDPPPNSSTTRLAYGLDGDIYLADWDGGNPARIADGTPVFTDCGHLWGEGSMWSPDGRHVGYRSAWNDQCSGSVFIADATGLPVASFAGGGWLLSWSPDSTRVATWDEHTVEIHGFDGVRQALLPVPEGCADPGDFDPVWSPDGLSVVINQCEVALDGAPPRRLPEEDPRSHLGWSYSRDGMRFAYVTYVPRDSLAITDAGGAEVLILAGDSDPSTGVSQEAYFSPVWSPSGDRVAFTWVPRNSAAQFMFSDSELRVVNVSTGKVTSLAAKRGITPRAFSPDGDRILFTTPLGSSDESGGLWSVNADGSHLQLLVPGTDWGDWQPQPADE